MRNCKSDHCRTAGRSRSWIQALKQLVRKLTRGGVMIVSPGADLSVDLGMRK